MEEIIFCAECGLPIDGDAHYPHEKYCPNFADEDPEEFTECDCDCSPVHPECCPACKKEMITHG